MSTDTGGAGGEDGNGTTKIDVRVPTQLLENIDEEYERRGYTSRSEAIRDALRDWLNPSVELSDDVLEDLATSRKQRESGETRSLDSVMDRYDVEQDNGDRDVQ
ncbi:ribbon-helix-helix domain-containing protein [Natrinema hispanicum]|uniref:Ribbon-helix-helix protein, copG family n=1 Tax=Natrinema hispanicum TaxID=392421 RepID=A0A1I0IU67_9EURY|nr:ribbon-helix-helix domain-containing protein [Natrinema hispanicum]SEU00806.1 Ribbon-helix-helix protein, copG family [Natrinema hispanicum]